MNWDLTGKYLLLFLTDGVLGYFLQFIGYSLAIHAFNKRKIEAKSFVLMTLVFSVFAFGVRRLPISYGFHTVIIMIICILVSYIIFKTAIYKTVLSVLLTTISILIFEIILINVFSYAFGVEKLEAIFQNNSSVDGMINIALLGFPTNFLLLTEMITLYCVLMKKSKRDGSNGEISKENC